MSVVNYAIREVINRLPSQVLSKLFGKVPGFECSFNPTSIEDQIRNTIIYGRVATDMGVVAGTERFLKLSHAQILHQDELGTSYHYAKEQLHGGEILSVHYHMLNRPPIGSLSSSSSAEVVTTSYDANGIGPMAQRDTPAQKQRRIQSRMKCPTKGMIAEFKRRVVTELPSGKLPIFGFTGNVLVRLVAKNTILATNNVGSGYFKVTLHNDTELTMIPPRSWRAYARLVELAVKAYIYKEEVIGLEQAEIFNGVSLGGIKSYISDLSDSEELYQTQLTKWAKIAFMHDRPAYARFLRAQINPTEYL